MTLRVEANKPVNTSQTGSSETLAYLEDKKDKEQKTQTGFLAYNNGTVPMTSGASLSPAPEGCNDIAVS